MAQCTEPTGQQGVVLVPDGGGGLGQHSIYVVDGAHLQYISQSAIAAALQGDDRYQKFDVF